jgi:hypothetical protein
MTAILAILLALALAAVVAAYSVPAPTDNGGFGL